MTDIDLAELRRLAEAATPGPWEKLGREERMDFWISSYDPDLGSKAVAKIPPLCDAFAANADYIAAASPDVLLALLDGKERAEGLLCEIEAATFANEDERGNAIDRAGQVDEVRRILIRGLEP